MRLQDAARTVAIWLACGLLTVGDSPAQGTDNLLVNPGFGEGILAPAGWGFNGSGGNRVSWQISPDGEAFVVLLEGSGRDWAGLTSRAIPVTAGEVLTVGAWVRALPGHSGAEADHLFVRFFARGRFVGQEGPTLADAPEEWRLLVGELTAPEGANRADVSLQIRSQVKVQVASVCLLRGRRAGDVARLLPAAPTTVKEWRSVDKAQNLVADENDNGLADSLEAFLGITPEDKAVSIRRTRRKTTSFQTPTGYRADNDLKVDVVIVCGNEERNIRSWAALGYEPHCMVGFRAGQAYVDGVHNGVQGRDEVQTAKSGDPLTCGPGSFYMVPTANRRERFREYFADAVRRGAKAACPEEPEFFSRAGYSEAFKREWRDFYGAAWEDPAGSVNARFKAERLKVVLERKLLQACYEGARSVDPDVRRFLLTHSPLSYTAWGITFGHHDALATGEVDAVIAQVWTGTARSAVRYEGEHRERTFENAYLEYASSVGLVRDLGVDLWFLMDPLEDNPDRGMADYHDNYRRTLAAALLFPDVDRFETMPWPTRIFGRVPDDFATEIGGIINVLSDMQNQETARFDRGAAGIGTFLSDSAMWQRGAPSASNMDCFYGIALPLLMRGIPVGVPHLDRAVEPGYLDRYRVLFVSYDMLKPMSPRINEALADWAREGGCLVVLGGEDAYNAAPLWWRDEGFESPQDHLLSLCGFDVSGRRILEAPAGGAEWKTVATTDYTGRSLENQATVEIDLTPFLGVGVALVKIEDSMKQDGWGALITRLSAEGLRDAQPVRIDVTPASNEERALIALDNRTGVNPEGFRFCDGESFVIYRFDFDPGSKATLRMEIGNQYVVSAAAGARDIGRVFEAVGSCRALGEPAIDAPAGEVIVTYDDSGADPLYAGPAGALLSENSLGKGSVLFFGAPPSCFARSAEAADQLRALAKYAIEEKLGDALGEQGYIKLERGRYVIAKTFEEEVDLRGRYVDVLAARLPLVSEVHLRPDELAVLYDAAPDMGGDPRVLFASSCVEWKSEEKARLRMVVSGAQGTFGTCRVFTGGRGVGALRASNAKGEEIEVEVTVEGETALLRYRNEPLGMGIEVGWEEAS